ncbi:MAG: NAD-dependent epimerase/dehydratase family protein [Deltaproteobacteria bacterium]|nr:NAD-dependent epimerase/dehydratase family protein [Deltaproteobacteria bacterium]
MKTLVTGGGGFLGRYIVEQLLAQQAQVRILARGHYPDLVQQGVECIQGSILDPRTVDRACHDIDTVFHCAAKVGVWGPFKDFYETNVIGTQNILHSCQAFHIRRFIYSSSSSVTYEGKDQIMADETLPYPKTFLSPYSQTKAHAEQLVLSANGKNNVLTCALRPHLIWGPRDTYIIPRLLTQAQKRKLRIIGDGKNLTDITYVENAARAHLLAAEALKSGSPVPGNTYFITQGKPVVLWEWVNELLKLFDLPIVTKHLSANMAYALGVGFEKMYALLHLHTDPPLTRLIAKQLSTTHTYSIQKAKDHFGYDPIISTAEGMQRLLIYDSKERQST